MLTEGMLLLLVVYYFNESTFSEFPKNELLGIMTFKGIRYLIFHIVIGSNCKI